MRRLLACLVVAAWAACGGKHAQGPLPPLPKEAYAHYLDGMLSEYSEDWGAAADALALAAKSAPDQPMIAVELARAQVKAKRVAAAQATLAAAREQWPKHPSVWFASGELQETSNPAGARKAYQRAIKLAPDEESAYLGLARLQDAKAARETLGKLVKRVPESIDGHYRLGVSLAVSRQFDNAIEQFRAVLERDPDHLDARLDLARGLRITGKMPEAVAQTRSAFDRSGQALDIAEELFYLLCEADDRQAAIDLLTLLDDDRSDADALAVVARFQRELGRIDEARTLAAKITKQDPAGGLVAAAEASLAASEFESAAELAMQVEVPKGSAADDDDIAQFALARRVAVSALIALARPQDALDAAASPRKLRPKDLELALLVAKAQADLKQGAAARATLAAFGATPAAAMARAHLAEHQKDYAGALAAVEPIAKAHPELPSPQNLAAYLLSRLGLRLDEADAYVRRARELAPGDPAVLDTLGMVRLRQGRAKDAVAALARANRIAPHEQEIAAHLAEARAALRSPRPR